ncbi:unnamed protein product [Urochloa decumbens]|uniref:Uncharacterized protein n=1 Tax=Urochloa decumbens TaxID=240449 RepID=A0ABC8Z8M7_9POAL
MDREQQGRFVHNLRPPTPPRDTTPAVDCVNWLGNCGVILILFETPSGFALLNYPGIRLFFPHAVEDIWADFGKDTMVPRDLVILREFQTFDDKKRAINRQTGLSSQLAKMIKNWIKPGETLAVGKAAYKEVIQRKMGIYCLCNDAVSELMWGLNNCMNTILPKEISNLTSKGHPKICQGMQIVLDRYDIHLKPEMVNKRIVEMLWGPKILEVSKIDTSQWDYLKLSTALFLLCYPEQRIKLGDSPQMLSEDEANILIGDAQKYKGRLNKDTCRIMYKDISRARTTRARALKLLRVLVNEARKICMKLDAEHQYGEEGD